MYGARGPGLGYEVDEVALKRIAANTPVERPKHVGVLHMPYGSTYYGPSYVSPTTVTGKEEGTIRGFTSQLWEDDGSTEFERIYEPVQNEGVFRME